jgi:uncharacterized membrane protein
MLSKVFQRAIMGLAMVMLVVPLFVHAQSPIVYGVMFYSPGCPHCREVITQHWPGIQAEFGDQLQVLFISIDDHAGIQLMRTAAAAMNIESTGVPMLIIGSEVMVGSVAIPGRAPDVIRAGLDAGGVGYPPIPGIDAVFAAALQKSAPAQSESVQPSPLSDPATMAAFVVLVGLIVGTGTMTAAWIRAARQNFGLKSAVQGVFGQRMALLGAVIGVGLAGSLLAGSGTNAIALVISIMVVAAFGVLIVYLFRSFAGQRYSRGLIPLTIAIGLLVAGYLSYVEVTTVEAACGVMGDCNTVQQSPYAQVLGIPVGVIGIIGYVVILSLWMVNQQRQRRPVEAVLWMMALCGVVFSLYLTFVEIFVIGATCVWCLTSAVVMGILLWLTAPAGLDALYPQRRSAMSCRAAL